MTLDYAPRLVITAMLDGWTMRRTGGGLVFLRDYKNMRERPVNSRTFTVLIREGLIEPQGGHYVLTAAGQLAAGVSPTPPATL